MRYGVARVVFLALLIMAITPWLLASSLLVLLAALDDFETQLAAVAFSSWPAALATLSLAHGYLRGADIGWRAHRLGWLVAAGGSLVAGLLLVDRGYWMTVVVFAAPLLFLAIAARSGAGGADDAVAPPALPRWTVLPSLAWLTVYPAFVQLWPDFDHQIPAAHQEAVTITRLLSTLGWTAFGIVLLVRRDGRVGRFGLVAGVAVPALLLLPPALVGAFALAPQSIGTWLTYVAITALCCATIRHSANAWVGAVVCLVAQLLFDLPVLGVLGHFSLKLG